MLLSRWSLFAVVLGLAAGGLASADPGGPPGRGGPRPPGPPPPEALQACSGAQAGAACTFQHDGHTVTGVCRPGPRGEPAACMPDRPPPPPRESVEACAGQQVGASCAFTFEGRQSTGICRPGPGGRAEAIACAPDGAPPPFGPPPEAVDACAQVQEGGACGFTDPEGRQVSGVCRAGPPGMPVACAPSR